MQSKAVKAAILVKNMKVERFNDYYIENKFVIDEFLRLQKEVDKADSDLITAKINSVNELVAKIKRPGQMF